jgi:sterol desaturase/sphingolipid hydroxylase (fatty acid hydroxylase superfamily)
VWQVQSGKEPIRLFRSDFLEFFTHVHPAVVLIVWVPVAIGFLIQGGLQRPVGASLWYMPAGFISGLLLWTFTEYVLHRFVFHFRPRNDWQKRLSFLFHGVHHAQPMVKSRLVMPPAVSIPLAVLFYMLFHLIFERILGLGHWIPTLFAGFVCGYIAYDMVHYSSHHFNLKSRYLKQVRRNHMRHHWKTPDKRFGVTSTFWDGVFGTRVLEA